MNIIEIIFAVIAVLYLLSMVLTAIASFFDSNK